MNYINEYTKMKNVFSGCIVGSAGSGKTITVLNVIHNMKNIYNKIYIYTNNEEPLYNYLQAKFEIDFLSISYDLNDLRKFKNEDYKGKTLIIFDNMTDEKDQQCITDLYFRGRYLGCSRLYLSQAFYKIPLSIRLQCEYVFILKTLNLRDLNLIKTEFSLNITKQQLKNMCNYVSNSEEFGNFFLIDMKASQNSGLTYRKNFITKLLPSNFNK